MKDQSGQGRLWKSNIRRKRSRGSQSTGKSKNLVASPLQKFMCKRTRSWKHPLYESVMQGLGKKTTKKGK